MTQFSTSGGFNCPTAGIDIQAVNQSYALTRPLVLLTVFSHSPLLNTFKSRSFDEEPTRAIPPGTI